MSRLAELARRPQPPPRPTEAAGEACDLCAEPLPPGHRHLADLDEGRIMCACRACTMLMDREGAGGARFRLIPERVRELQGFALDGAHWERLRIPVELAFFFRSTRAERVVALYPGPMGATESLLELDAWVDLEEANPALRELEPDVEALLVNRARGASDHFLVPIDACYRLVALIRARWHGLGGGSEVWEEIDRFFLELREEAT